MLISKKLNNDFQKLLRRKASYQRNFEIAALISTALESVGINTVLVGGTAVEIYSRGGYSTQDIDMVCLGSPKLTQVMSELGFKKLGKDYIEPKHQIYVEFPSSQLGPNELYQRFQIKNYQLNIISLEDLIVDRLCAFKYWSSALDGLNAILLLESNPSNEARLEIRAKQENVTDALHELRKIKEKVIRKKLSRNQSNALLEKAIQNFKKNRNVNDS